MTVVIISEAAKAHILKERNHRLRLLGRAKPRLLYHSDVILHSDDGRDTHFGPGLTLSFYEVEGLRPHEWQLIDISEDCTVPVGPLAGFPAEKNYVDWDEAKRKFTVMTYLEIPLDPSSG